MHERYTVQCVVGVVSLPGSAASKPNPSSLQYRNKKERERERELESWRQAHQRLELLAHGNGQNQFSVMCSQYCRQLVHGVQAAHLLGPGRDEPERDLGLEHAVEDWR